MKAGIGNQEFILDIADTDNLKINGLSGRKSLKKNHGMIFIYEKPDFYSFWMKEMNFPLDFIWVNSDIIEDLSENVPIPESEDIPVITPKKPVDKIIEVEAGTIGLLNLKIGDKIILH